MDTNQEFVESALPGVAAADADVTRSAKPEVVREAPDSASRFGPGIWLFVVSSYLAIAVLIWSRIWFGHPTSTTMCGCGDNSGAIWVIGWPAYAISHGITPLHSTAVFHPTGMNLLSNAGVLAMGIPLAPVTWAFGPVASFNVALTLGPVFSALAMFVLLRRWVAWTPAAYIGGLLYGFSPFVLVTSSLGWINLGTLIVPPLIVLCLDELIFRQPRRPLLVGIFLGTLATLQFFISTEVLVIVALMTLTGVALVVLHARTNVDALRSGVRRASAGLIAAAATAGLLLAYPAWYALKGPSHLSGKDWPRLAQAHTLTLSDLFVPASPARPSLQHLIGGYQGDTISPRYLGLGLLAVVIGGVMVWHRDRRLWLFGIVGLLALLLSLGSPYDVPLPWDLFANTPFFENVLPGRFILVVYLCLAVMLGLILDHTHDAVTAKLQNADGTTRRLPWPIIAAMAVAALAIVPIATYESVMVPMTVRSVVLPTWFRTSAPPPGSHQVLLVLPLPFILEGPLTWQAVNHYSYSLIGGTGPQTDPSRAGVNASGQAALYQASFSTSPPRFVHQDIAAVRQAIANWGTTMAVIPDQKPLPQYERIPSLRFAVALLTAASGQAPQHQGGAWIWRGLHHSRGIGIPTISKLAACTNRTTAEDVHSITLLASCVLAADRSIPNR